MAETRDGEDERTGQRRESGHASPLGPYLNLFLFAPFSLFSFCPSQLLSGSWLYLYMKRVKRLSLQAQVRSHPLGGLPLFLVRLLTPFPGYPVPRFLGFRWYHHDAGSCHPHSTPLSRKLTTIPRTWQESDAKLMDAESHLPFTPPGAG